MKSASESKYVAPRVLACAAVAILAAAPAAWAQNSQRPDEGTGAPNPSMDMSTPGTNGNTAAPPPPAPIQRQGATQGSRSHSGSAGHVKPGGGPNGAGAGGSGTGTGTGGGAGGAGSAGSSGYCRRRADVGGVVSRDGLAATTQEGIMRSNSRNRVENDEIDGDAIEADDLDTTVHVDVATGRIKFHSTWALTADAPPEYARHAVELALDSDTMERYAALDDGTRMRVHAILHDTVQAMLDRLPDTNESLTLTIEVTDAMLDAASHLQ